MTKKVERLYCREGANDSGRIYCTLPGGFVDEANFCYDKDILSDQDFEQLTECFSKLIRPSDKVYWVIVKIGTRYTAYKHTWKIGGCWADSITELISKIEEYYTRQTKNWSYRT